MILHRYFARRFLTMFLSILTVFALFLALLDLVDQLRRFGSDVSFGQVVYLTLLNLPSGLYEILPLVMILSTVALFLSLARSSELVVTRAAGRSALRSLISPVVVALLIGAVGVTMINPIVAAMLHNAGSLIVVFNSARLVRQGEELGSFEPESKPAGTDDPAGMAAQPA